MNDRLIDGATIVGLVPVLATQSRPSWEFMETKKPCLQILLCRKREEPELLCSRRSDCQLEPLFEARCCDGVRHHII
jgi:hypothetical protein